MPSNKPSPSGEGYNLGVLSPEAQGASVSAMRCEYWASPAPLSGSLNQLPPNQKTPNLICELGNMASWSEVFFYLDEELRIMVKFDTAYNKG